MLLFVYWWAPFTCACSLYCHYCFCCCPKTAFSSLDFLLLKKAQLKCQHFVSISLCFFLILWVTNSKQNVKGLCTLQKSTAQEIIQHFEGEHADLVICDGAPDGPSCFSNSTLSRGHAHTHTHTHAHTHTHTFSLNHTHTHTHTHTHSLSHTHVHTHTHTFSLNHTHMHTHTHTYTHTHIHRQ